MRHCPELIRVALTVLFLFAALPGWAAGATVETEVRIAVHAAENPVNGAVAEAMEARLYWLGTERRVALERDGTVFKGVARGPAALSIGLSLFKSESGGGGPIRVHEGLSLLSPGVNTLSFVLRDARPQLALPVSTALGWDEVAENEERWALGGVAWTMAVFILLLGFARSSRDRVVRWTPEPAPRRGIEGIGWLLFSAAWTWPAVLAGGDRIVGRHFDALGTVWTLDAVGRMGAGFSDALSNWPAGADYSQLDSFLFLALSPLVDLLGAGQVHGLLAVFGLALSAHAASSLAVELGARRPFHLLAGLFFAGSGLGANALLEGHVYLVFNPWMPWFALMWWRATGNEGTAVQAIFAGALFCLCLGTSGYLGVAAAVVALGVGTRALRRRRWVPLLAAAAVVLPVCLLYLSALLSSETPSAQYALDSTLRMGSVAFSSLGNPSPELDRAGHSWALGLSPLMVVLAVLAAWYRVGPRWVLGCTAIAGLLLAMGPVLAVDVGPGTASIPSPLAFLWDLPLGRWLRFPGRFAWAPLLCGGALASLGATALAGRVGASARVLLLIAVVDAMIMVGLPLRQSERVVGTPSAYGTSEGPVFALTPEGAPANTEVDAWLNAVVCAHQIGHQRALAEDCVAVPVTDGARWPLGRAVARALLAGDAGFAAAMLTERDFGHISWHPGWVGGADRVRIEAALGAIDAAPMRSLDGGTEVVLYSLAQPPEPNGRTGIGPDFSAEEPIMWQPRFDLAVPPSLSHAQFSLRITDPRYINPVRVRFTNDASVPGDRPSDGIYAAQWSGMVDAAVVLSVEMTREGGGTEILWEHPVTPLGIENEVLSFRLSEDGTVAPMLRALDTFSPDVRNRGAQITALGWTAVGALLGLFLVAGRRR